MIIRWDEMNNCNCVGDRMSYPVGQTFFSNMLKAISCTNDKCLDDVI